MLHASSGRDDTLARQSSVALAKQRSAAERSKRQEAERRSKDSQRESDELEQQLSRVRSAIADVQAGGDSGSERSSEDLDSLIHDVYDKFVSPRPAPAHYQGGSKEASDRARRAHQEEREREQRARERAESELRHLQKELERQQAQLNQERDKLASARAEAAAAQREAEAQAAAAKKAQAVAEGAAAAKEMVDEGGPELLPDFVCPISQMIMEDPVIW